MPLRSSESQVIWRESIDRQLHLLTKRLDSLERMLQVVNRCEKAVNQLWYQEYGLELSPSGEKLIDRGKQGV